MSPLSLPVLGAAAVMSSPALYGAFVDGTTTMETALTRFLVCAVLCWVGFSALASLIGPPPRTATDADGLATSDGATTVTPSSGEGELAA
jgi:hypothetical protein